MENLKINEAPIRTSRNFNINNVKLENINIPNEIKNFENVIIPEENLKVENEISNISLTYGLSDVLTEQVKNNANKKIKIILNDKKNKDVKLDFKFDKNNENLVENIEIIAKEESEGTIIIKYLSDEDIEAYHNGIIRVEAKQNAKVNIILVNLMNTKSNNFMAIENTVEESAGVNYTIIDFGGLNSITNYYSNLVGENSDNKINTIYLGKENQLLDLNYIAELKGAKSNIDIEVQGALRDTAKKHFKGTIDFKKGCKKATGNENEACMLLSDTAKSLALPMLLCSEEDVEGNHSSSSGKIGEKELFYIMSRGFELKEAIKLIVRAKFNKILENIQSEELREFLLEQIDARLE